MRFQQRKNPPKEVHEIREVLNYIKQGNLHPVQAFFEECMLRTEKNGGDIWKAGLFICDEEGARKYPSIATFWLWSSIALIENTWLGKPFYADLDSSLQWQEIPVEEFSEKYQDLVRNYQPADTFNLNHADLEGMTFAKAYSVLDTDNFKSLVATTKAGFLSLFDMSEDMIRKQRRDFSGGP